MAKENRSVKNFPNSRNVPKLRFWEFANEWRAYYLKEIAEKINNKNNDNKIITVFSNSAVQGIVLQSDYFDKSIANKENLDGYYIVKPFDFVYNPRLSSMAEVGAMSVNKTNLTGLVSPLYTVFRIKEKNVNIPFLEYLFKSKVWHNYMRSIANYGARDDRMNVKSDDFYNLPLFIPCFSEQKKVSTFLSLIENRIQTQKKIIEQLETLIKGGGYKLFNKKIRFKNTDLSEFPSWESKKGNEVFSNISNKSHNSELPILAITQEYGAIPRDLIDFKISVTDKSVESYKVVEKGDFIISLRSFQGGIEYSEYKGICSPAYIILRNKIEVNSYFYKYYFKSESYIKQLNKKLEGIRDGKMISYAYFSDINLPLPSVDEQTKIANFLSSIQEKIETEKQILEKLELQKKFLLANLFV